MASSFAPRSAAALAALVLAAAADRAVANEVDPAFVPALEALAEDQIAAVLANPTLIEAIRSQNARTAGMDQAAIDKADQEWRAQVGAAAKPMIDDVMGREASEALRQARDAAGGLFTEIFLMDQVGLNVAASDVTSDYWQGDEDKWQRTYGAGTDALHLGAIELDESTQTYQSQVSVTVTDPDTGAPIGAATFGVDVGYLQ